ncbi:hypothetical protein AAKU55_001832 [Oxalobacteraceae bacterium GrIS 1.11]
MSMDADRAAQAARKNNLIAQGQLYRVGIVHARASVSAALRPEALLEGAVELAVGFAAARIETLLSPGGARLQNMMPYVLTAVSFIGRKKLFKQALGVGLAAAVAVAWLARRKRTDIAD